MSMSLKQMIKNFVHRCHRPGLGIFWCNMLLELRDYELES